MAASKHVELQYMLAVLVLSTPRHTVRRVVSERGRTGHPDTELVVGRGDQELLISRWDGDGQRMVGGLGGVGGGAGGWGRWDEMRHRQRLERLL